MDLAGSSPLSDRKAGQVTMGLWVRKGELWRPLIFSCRPPAFSIVASDRNRLTWTELQKTKSYQKFSLRREFVTLNFVTAHAMLKDFFSLVSFQETPGDFG